MEIYRNIEEQFSAWKNARHRKPLLLHGARQIGKTWSIEHFGASHYKYTAKFNFDETAELCAVFERTKDPTRLIQELSLYTDVPLLPGETLLIFDEIQQCEAALNSLKYFCEQSPEYHIIAAGSLLGVAVRKRHMKVPVGKVTTMDMRPVTFSEFLHSADERTWQYLNALDEVKPLPEIILSKVTSEYRRYLICGGMPEAITALLENRGMGEVDHVLQDILDLYELDFSKYADTATIPRIHTIWNSLPSQLAKENRKFLYRVVKDGARAREYEDALLWLENAGLTQRIFNVTKPGMPLNAYKDLSAFKLYACDCGLLRRLARLSPQTLLSNTAQYTEFRGALAENAVMQALLGQCDDIPYYWTSNSQAEVDFILQFPTAIIPAEVKSETRISGKSLAVYNNRFAPPLRIRYSMNNLKFNDGLISCPLPLADWTARFVEMSLPTTPATA